MTLNKLHYINVDKHGTFDRSETFQADIDAIFQGITTKKMVIHFHGGLVPKESGKETAERMMNNFLGSNSHVVSFVWETGLMEIIKSNLTELNQTELFNKLIEIVTKKVGDKLGLDAVGAKGINEMDYEEVKQELKKTKPLVKYEPTAIKKAKKINESKLPKIQDDIEDELADEFPINSDLVTVLEKEAPKTALFDQQFSIKKNQEGQKGIISLAVLKELASIVIKVIKRYMNHTQHDLYPTIVEEVLRAFYIADFGKWAWEQMKEIAHKGMWEPNDGILPKKQHVGTYFMMKLNEHIAKNPDFKVDLIGHSAGSIAVCHLFRNFPNFKVRNVILLAPACTSQLFYDEILTKPNRYQNLTMFTMDDEGEKNDQLLKFVYTHSLLYLVSGLLEKETDTPILGMQRFLNKKETFENQIVFNEIAKFFNKSNLIVPKTENTAPNGFQCNSISHGDFDNDELTLASLKHIINS